MEPKRSLPRSQQPVICPYPKPNFTPSHPTSWLPILVLSSYLWLGLQSGQISPPKPCMKLAVALIRATCPAHLLLDLITQVIFCEYIRQSSSLCSFLHSPVTSSLLGSNILLSTLFSTTLSFFLPRCYRPSFTPIQNMQKYSCVYFNLYIFIANWKT